MSEKDDKLENFERAFSSGTGSCRVTCDCGKIYFNATDRGCWEPGELDELQRLEQDGKAISTDYTIDYIDFEGKQFANGCDCWHSRAIKIMAWLDAHAHKMAEYLSLEKERKQSIADHSPLVREPEEKR